MTIHWVLPRAGVLAALLLIASLLGPAASAARPPAAASGQTFTVNSLYDANNASAIDTNPGDGVCQASIGSCTFRAALMETNALSGTDTIAFATSGEIVLRPSLPHIQEHLIIRGPGSGLLTLNGNGAVQILITDLSVNLTIADLELLGGRSPDNTAVSNGGAIFNNAGTLTVTRMRFIGNRAGTGGGGGAIANGGGIVRVENSVFSNNQGDLGGAVYNRGLLTVIQSAFWQNRSAGSGSAIFNDDSRVIIANSAFVANQTTGTDGHGAIMTGGSFFVGKTFITNTTLANNVGGAVYGWENTLRNTILSGSTNGFNCPISIINGGGNLDDGTTCGWQAPLNGSVNSTNPMLDLTDYAGGVVRLLPGSPAINTALMSICAAAVGDPSYGAGGVDQRGALRPIGPGCDKGAYEYQLPPVFLPMVIR